MLTGMRKGFRRLRSQARICEPEEDVRVLYRETAGLDTYTAILSQCQCDHLQRFLGQVRGLRSRDWTKAQAFLRGGAQQYKNFYGEAADWWAFGRTVYVLPSVCHWAVASCKYVLINRSTPRIPLRPILCKKSRNMEHG